MNLLFIIVGVFAGILSGLFGVGGGLVIIPILIVLFNFSQLTAVGTSLVALLAPIGLGGVYLYYKSGNIGLENIKQGVLISVGMFMGAYFGAKLALMLPGQYYKRIFSIFLIIIAIKTWKDSFR